MKTPVCRGCGRFYIDRQWRYQINVEADEVACCPSCLRMEEERDRLLYESNRRRTAQQMKNGFGPPPIGFDVFDGFRDE